VAVWFPYVTNGDAFGGRERKVERAGGGLLCGGRLTCGLWWAYLSATALRHFTACAFSAKIWLLFYLWKGRDSACMPLILPAACCCSPVSFYPPKSSASQPHLFHPSALVYMPCG